MWSKIVDNIQSVLPQVYEFATGILDMFNRKLSDIAEDANLLGSFFLELLPERLMDETLLSVMVGTVVPVALVIFIVKVFVNW